MHIRLDAISRQRPRQWGGGWLALEPSRQISLDSFFAGHLPASRPGPRREQILQALVTQRLLAPGSEWQLHRDGFARTARADLLGGDFGLAEIHRASTPRWIKRGRSRKNSSILCATSGAIFSTPNTKRRSPIGLAP